MKKRTFLTALAALPFAQLPHAGFAQDGLLVQISNYLNRLRSVQGRFTQINADGSRATGRYFLRRPGFIRFEYDQGDALVIADGINIGVFDAKSNTGVQKYPLGATPLRFLLRDQIDLTQQNLARDLRNRDGFTSVVLQDPQKPRDGAMTLVFSNNPAMLKQWTVTEKNGQQTTVVLDTLERVGTLDRNLFNIELTAIRRQQQRR